MRLIVGMEITFDVLQSCARKLNPSSCLYVEMKEAPEGKKPASERVRELRAVLYKGHPKIGEYLPAK